MTYFEFLSNLCGFYNWGFCGSPQQSFRDPSLHRCDTILQCDKRTDRQTGRRTPRW